jgi:hypothetical protein
MVRRTSFSSKNCLNGPLFRLNLLRLTWCDAPLLLNIIHLMTVTHFVNENGPVEIHWAILQGVEKSTENIVQREVLKQHFQP